ncbi:hypothetical protein MKW98_000645 [Papaver atlanticum]|uniref:RNA-binding protein n=1 Tax=Papaver atlanticum TaxID=357466 RepID=A0AAD4RYR4_9MAGN|nr:hypothetical protein MKW98_000645 [Papaver atlanticum]
MVNSSALKDVQISTIDASGEPWPDWRCLSCNNVNAGYRGKCNRCGNACHFGASGRSSGGGGRGRGRGADDSGPIPSVDTVYVSNLVAGTDELMLAKHFGSIGLIKEKNNRKLIKLYLNENNEPKGDATITYDDPEAALAAVDWFNLSKFKENVIEVSMAQYKRRVCNIGQQMNPVEDPIGVGGEGRGRGRVASGEAGPMVTAEQRASRELQVQHQRKRDWSCPNKRCGNVNLGFRDECKRCMRARPPVAIFGAYDWACSSCGYINMAKRTKCIICSADELDDNEGGVRGGRFRGYRELDEEEIKETRRRPRDAEQMRRSCFAEISRRKEQEREGTDKGKYRTRNHDNSESSKSRECDDHSSSRDYRLSWSRDRERDREERRKDPGRHYYHDRSRVHGHERDRGRHTERNMEERVSDQDRHGFRHYNDDGGMVHGHEGDRGRDRHRHRDRTRDYRRSRSRASDQNQYGFRHYDHDGSSVHGDERDRNLHRDGDGERDDYSRSKIDREH